MKKVYRLKLQRDFDAVFKQGKTASLPQITIKYIKNSLNHCRLAEIISKKTAKKAVQRNLLRRRIKEIIRTKYLNKMDNWDIVVIPKAELVEKNFAELQETIRLILEKAKLI